MDEDAELLLTKEATATTHQRCGVNWETSVEKWRSDKLSQGIKPSTFDRLDRKLMDYVLQRFAYQRPENGKVFARLAPFNPRVRNIRSDQLLARTMSTAFASSGSSALMNSASMRGGRHPALGGR